LDKRKKQVEARLKEKNKLSRVRVVSKKSIS
jgi:hypothetical protein